MEKIREELYNEKLKEKLKKEFHKKENQNELNKFFIKKRDEEEKIFYEKLDNVDKLTLPIQHEERLEQYREYMNKLTEKIDKNVGIYKHYHVKNNSVNISQDAKSNNYKEEFKVDNYSSIILIL